MKKLLTTILFIFSHFLLLGQTESSKANKDIGLNYYGELGFRPGLELDFSQNLWNAEKQKKTRVQEKYLNLRPSIAYYRYPNYSNNALAALKLNYQARFYNKANTKYLLVEPFVKVGYLRYFFSGSVFKTAGTGFKEARFSGSNSFVFGSGIDLGAYLTKRFDWLFGFDYYAESTEDKLILHRFVAKLGTRIKLNSK